MAFFLYLQYLWLSLFNHGKQVHGPSSEPRLLSACVQCGFISPSPIFCALSWVRELSLPIQFSMVSHGSIFFFPCRTDFRILTKLPMSIWRLEETWTTWTPGKIAFCVLFQLLFHMPLFFWQGLALHFRVSTNSILLLWLPKRQSVGIIGLYHDAHNAY